jgi:hypothetical protein
MEFDIDVSGEDILTPDYTICIASQDSLIKGFKFSQDYVKILHSRFGQGLYRYEKSHKGKAQLKIRIYCTIIYYLFKSMNIRNTITLNICRDFDGKERDIENNLNFLLKEKLGLHIEKYIFRKLDDKSHAHRYSYLMRKDTRNQLKTYVSIKPEDIEKFLRK